MNDEQRKLAEENMGIVFYTLKKYFGGITADEDLVSAGYEGLCIAAEGFDPERGKFSTYAAQCIRYCVMTELRSRKKHSQNLYLSSKACDLTDSTFDGFHGKEDEAFGDVETADLLRDFEMILTETERQIFLMKRQGMSALDISVEVGLTRGKVYAILREMKALWKMFGGTDENKDL